MKNLSRVFCVSSLAIFFLIPGCTNIRAYSGAQNLESMIIGKWQQKLKLGYKLGQIDAVITWEYLANHNGLRREESCGPVSKWDKKQGAKVNYEVCVDDTSPIKWAMKGRAVHFQQLPSSSVIVTSITTDGVRVTDKEIISQYSEDIKKSRSRSRLTISFEILDISENDMITKSDATGQLSKWVRIR